MRPQSVVEAEAAARTYIASVADGSLVVGRFVRLAVERHLRDLRAVENGERADLRFDADAARYAFRFFKYIKHTKGEWSGEPFHLEGWEAFIVWCVFGWHRKDKKRWVRRFRLAYISVARKNGKTALEAAIGLLLLIWDQEPGAEVYVAATKRDQAKITWNAAAGMVRRDAELRKRVEVLRGSLTIAVRDDAETYFQPLGADANTLDGLNPHGALIDELHAHPTSAVLDVLRSALGARRQPLLFVTTTAGAKRDGVCWDMDDTCCKVLEGVFNDDSLFAFVARLDEGDDWHDESLWIKANPNLEVSVKLDNLRDDVREAVNKPAYQNEFLRKRMNLWTEGVTAWMPLDVWDSCARPAEPDPEEGALCLAAFDLSTVRDTTALVLLFPREDGSYLIRQKIYIPAENITERVRTDRVPFDVWRDLGLVTATPGDIVDQGAIMADLAAAARRYDLREITGDRWNAAKFMTDLEAEGFNVTEFRQGYKSMTPAIRETERALLSQRLLHDGSPVMRWMFSNVAVVMDPAGNVKFDKSASPGSSARADRNRIDGVLATVMAVGRASEFNLVLPSIITMGA